eukprot:GAFH01005072.1.p3 GENE.GAFH01005072.1~~GAFH01005072.1.p3  ORF type:complete len:78 (+),score=3.87 GAFH01005072.1:176-409(+)
MVPRGTERLQEAPGQGDPTLWRVFDARIKLNQLKEKKDIRLQKGLKFFVDDEGFVPGGGRCFVLAQVERPGHNGKNE